MTRSMITRMPRSRAVRMNSATSPSEPSRGSTPSEVGDVVAVVAVGRRLERHEPEAGHAELGEVVEPMGEALEVARAVVVPVHVRLDVEAVDDRGLPPEVAAVGDPHRPAAFSVGQHVLAERVDERVLLGADVVQVDAVEAELGDARRGGRGAGPGRTRRCSGLRRPRRAWHPRSRSSNASRRVELPREVRRAGGSCRHWSCAIARASSSVGAQLRCTCTAIGPVAAGVAVGVDERAEGVARLVDGDEAVGPLGAFARGLGAHRGARRAAAASSGRLQTRARSTRMQAVGADLLARRAGGG